MEIKRIIEAIQADKIWVTDHADEEATEDHLTIEEIFSSIMNGEVIENYPSDKPYPSCLIFGKNVNDEPIHSVWAFNSGSGWATLITVYRPDPQRWIDWKKRRRKE